MAAGMARPHRDHGPEEWLWLLTADMDEDTQDDPILGEGDQRVTTGNVVSIAGTSGSAAGRLERDFALKVRVAEEAHGG